MSRSDLRRNQRELEKQKNVYVFNEHQYKQKIEELRNDLKLDIIQQLFGAIIISLHDEFGFGPKCVNKFIDKFNSNMDCINNGNVSLDDFNNWCNENDIQYQVKKMVKEAS